MRDGILFVTNPAVGVRERAAGLQSPRRISGSELLQARDNDAIGPKGRPSDLTTEMGWGGTSPGSARGRDVLSPRPRVLSRLKQWFSTAHRAPALRTFPVRCVPLTVTVTEGTSGNDVGQWRVVPRGATCYESKGKRNKPSPHLRRRRVY